MTLRSLYKINDFLVEDGSFSASITFNSGHEIFKGHFPGQPVVPGVCLIHIIKEISIKITENETVMTDGSNIKFLQVIDPSIHDEVHIKGTFSSESKENIKITATILNEDLVFCKFKGTFKLA